MLYLHSYFLTLSLYKISEQGADISSHGADCDCPAHTAYELCIMARLSETFPKYIPIISGTLFALRITTNICPSDNIFLCCLLALFFFGLFGLGFCFFLLVCYFGLWAVMENEVRAEI